MKTSLLAAARRGVLATVLLALCAPLPAQLPSLGGSGDLGVGEERRLGDRIAREIYRDPDYLDDPLLTEYVQGIWQPLLAAARQRGDLSPELDERFAWVPFLNRERSVNAFALPGGYIGVNLGLIALVSNRDELAAVLGHELSHVTQRHISRLIANQSRQTPLLIGAMILGALAARSSPDAANAAILGGQALAVQSQLNFSRDMEREADRIGFGLMTQAGFAPSGVASMFGKLEQASRLNDNGAFPYLRTHPLSTERIAEAQLRRQAEPDRAPAAGPPRLLEHAQMAARARVLADPGVDTLRALVAEPDGAGFAAQAAPRRVGTLYAGTLAALRLRDFERAGRLAGRLAQATAGDSHGARLARLLQAEVALARGDAAQAQTLLEPLAGAAGNAGQRADMLLWAQAQAQAGRPERAVERLQAWLATRPGDARAWTTLAGAQTAAGQGGRAARAEAEARVAHFDYAGALDRLKAAQEMLRRAGGADHFEASIVDTRTRQVQQLLREQTLQDKVDK